MGLFSICELWLSHSHDSESADGYNVVILSSLSRGGKNKNDLVFSSETLISSTDLHGRKSQKKIHFSYSRAVFMQTVHRLCYKPRKGRLFELTIPVLSLITLFQWTDFEGRSGLEIQYTFSRFINIFPYFHIWIFLYEISRYSFVATDKLCISELHSYVMPKLHIPSEMLLSSLLI
jgi:hypothetical protein